MAIKRGLGIYLAKIKYSSVNVESSDERDWKGATSSVVRLSKQGYLVFTVISSSTSQLGSGKPFNSIVNEKVSLTFILMHSTNLI